MKDGTILGGDLIPLAKYLGIRFDQFGGYPINRDLDRCPNCNAEIKRWQEGLFSAKKAEWLTRFLNFGEYAEREGVSVSTVRRWIKTGRLSKKDGLVRLWSCYVIDSEKNPSAKKAA
jgi:hypothetical protein